jgi:radical SAM superfamily enzyme YgiQ (UPF0313 family)
MSRYDVVLFSDSRISFGRPAGLYRISCQIRSLGFTAKPIWNFNNMTDSEFMLCISKFISKDTKVVGVSATIMNDPFDYSSEHFFGIADEKFRFRLRFIKKKFPNVKIVVGGAQVDAADDHFLSKYQEVDYFVRGQGEEIIKHLLQGSPTSKHLDGIDVISDKEHPFRDFNKTQNILNEEDVILSGEALPLELARGCIFSCAFCNYDLLGKKANDFTRSIEHLVEELKNNYNRFGTTRYYIIDDLINDSHEKVELLEKVASRLPFDLSLTGYNRLDLYWRFPDLAKRLADIGFKAALFGIETINDRSGKAVGKGLGKKRIEETLMHLRDTWKENVLIEGSFIIGLPYDNAETVLELEEWLMNMIDRDIFQSIDVNPLNLNPFNKKSQMFNNPEKYGYKFNISNDYKTVRGNRLNHWYKDDYSYQQAMIDAERLNSKISDKLLYNRNVNVFGLPFHLGLLGKEADDFFKALMNNQPYLIKDQYAPGGLKILCKEHRSRYMKSLLF